MEREYYPPGFTDRVLEYLKEHHVEVLMEPSKFGIWRGTITSEQLLKIAEMLPRGQLRERQNDGPNLKAFLEVAKSEPRALFEIYVIPKIRPDERITVDGALIPRDRQDLVKLLRRRARARPDEYFEDVEINGIKYVRMWWD
jgi:hypothetical protein